MRQALVQAQKALGQVSPNPPVGCVIVDPKGQILAKAYHKKAGLPHAEIEALKQIKNHSQLKGATLVVTLEPCAHQGRTPSCAQALARSPISTVVYGLQDPNPLVAGKGCKILSQAGKKIIHHPLPELEELAEVFFCNMKKQKAFVALKMATSMDGQMALRDGSSKWITGPAARHQAHYLRGLYDAVLVGVQTVLLDNPQLNSRHPQFKNKTQKLIILDPKLSLLPQTLNIEKKLNTYNLFQHFKKNNLLIIVSPSTYEALKKTNRLPALEPYLTLCPCPLLGDDSIYDLQHLTKALYQQHKICSVLVEGGAKTHQHFINQQGAERLYQFIAPIVLGGEQKRLWTQNLKAPSLDTAWALKNLRAHQFEKDWLFTGLFSFTRRF